MANQKHLDIIKKQGVETWNKWRSEHSDSRLYEEDDPSSQKSMNPDQGRNSMEPPDLRTFHTRAQSYTRYYP